MYRQILSVAICVVLIHEADAQRHQPSCLAVIDQGRTLLVGHFDGTLVEYNVDSKLIISRKRLAQSIHDMVVTPRGVLILDSKAKRLLRLDRLSEEGSLTKLCDVGAGSERVQFDQTPDGSHRLVLITSKWARELAVVQQDEGGQVRSQWAIDLPFAPQEMAKLKASESQWLIADAFGSRLAVVDVAARKLLRLHRVEGHNIRGVAVSSDGRQVLLAHQRMDSRGLADYEELHWGRLISNDVQLLEVSALYKDAVTPLAGWRNSHGGIGGAMGDPSALLIHDEAVITAFSGVGEVSIERKGQSKRIAVGRGPVDVAVVGQNLFVANRFDDSISIIDLDELRFTSTIALFADEGEQSQGRQPNSTRLTAVQRGEQLFYDATLSHQGWISCHSCHTDGHSNGLLVDTLGDGDYGSPKRVPSLLSSKATGPWGWTGGSPTLKSQIRKSVLTTMHGDRPLDEQQVADLAAYLQSLPTPEPPSGDELAKQGAKVFGRRCSSCHAPPRYTTAELYDVGTADKHGRRRFNPPSLLGVWHRSRLLHDGSASGLRDLLLNHQHPSQGRETLDPEAMKSLLAFLKTL